MISWDSGLYFMSESIKAPEVRFPKSYSRLVTELGPELSPRPGWSHCTMSVPVLDQLF